MNGEHLPIEERLSAYIDGSLSDTERVALETELADDDSLRAQLETLQATVDLLHTLPTLKAPRDFRLNPAIYGKKQANILQVNFWRIAGAVGLAASILMIVGGLLLTGDNDQTENTNSIAFEKATASAKAQLISPSEDATLLREEDLTSVTTLYDATEQTALEGEQAADSNFADDAEILSDQDMEEAQTMADEDTAASDTIFNTPALENAEPPSAVAEGVGAAAPQTATSPMVGEDGALDDAIFMSTPLATMGFGGAPPPDSARNTDAFNATQVAVEEAPAEAASEAGLPEAEEDAPEGLRPTLITTGVVGIIFSIVTILINWLIQLR